MGVKSSKDIIHIDEQLINTKERDASHDKEFSEEKHQDLALKFQQTEYLSVSEFDHGRKVLGRSPISFSNNDNSPVLRKQINE